MPRRALELHARGWNSLYVDKPMIAGLQPETFESFIGQRSRWCRGMVQILLLKNPLFKHGLTLAQRLCYLSSSMFWLFPLSRIVFIFAPMCYIFFDMKIYVANQQEFIAYTLTYMLVGSDDPELCLRAVPLALGVRRLRIHPVGHAVPGRRQRVPRSAPAEVQRHRQGRRA